MKSLRNLLLWLLFPFAASSQQHKFPFEIRLEEFPVQHFNGLHSYAWAKEDNHILLVGGRTDGLHRRQPFAAFRPDDNNIQLLVLDVVKGTVYSRSLAGLPVSVAEQLQSTNMQFLQDGNDLVLTGGYGYSPSKGDHITHPYLLNIRVSETIEAILNGIDPAPFIVQVRDENMAVTGGRMAKLNDRYYLVGGHRFDGRYNPHGPDHGPGFVQQYTNQVRTFGLNRKGLLPVIETYRAYTDSLLLHRRDYNLVPGFDDKGKEKLTIFSGVFQYEADIPYSNLTDITVDGISELKNFSQQFNHYHTASLSIFQEKTGRSFSLFFGGLSLHTVLKDGTIQKDEQVPFVNHISLVEREKNRVSEFILPWRLPAFLGAAAEFIPATNRLYSSGGVLKADQLPAKQETLVGYMIGGIESTAPNVFFSPPASATSKASARIFKVYIKSL